MGELHEKARAIACLCSRMKHQLRDSDMIGRLGGDEFGVLLPRVHNRMEIEGVVQRLEGAFQEPFDAGGISSRDPQASALGSTPKTGHRKMNC
jgi:GGDEF domain-containing protein